MTPTELKTAIISISGSMQAFARDYGLNYRTVQNWCAKPPPRIAVLFVNEILRNHHQTLP